MTADPNNALPSIDTPNAHATRGDAATSTDAEQAAVVTSTPPRAQRPNADTPLGRRLAAHAAGRAQMAEPPKPKSVPAILIPPPITRLTAEDLAERARAAAQAKTLEYDDDVAPAPWAAMMAGPATGAPVPRQGAQQPEAAQGTELSDESAPAAPPPLASPKVAAARVSTSVVGLEGDSNTASDSEVTTPNEATKAAVMKATPEIFKFERVTSGVSAVMYETVRRWALYKLEGFASMTAYAEAKLGVIGKANNAAYARAGKAAWAHFPAIAQRSVDSLVGRKWFTPVNLAGLPSVPGVGLLRELPAAIKRTKPAERAALLERVGSGEMSHSDLRQQGRKNAKKTTFKDGSTAVPKKETATREIRVPKGFSRPSIFDDAAEIDQASTGLREIASMLTRVLDGWSAEPGPDVHSALPLLKEILVGLNAATTKLQKITPRSICAACRGVGGRCRPCHSTGWLPAKPSAPPKNNKLSKKKVGSRK